MTQQLLIPQGLRTGEQVELLAQTPGPVRCRVADVALGGFAPTFLFPEMDDDQVFNGDGSGGALVLGPITIVQNADQFDGSFVWDFQSVGVSTGWIVIFAVQNGTPVSPASIVVRSNNVGPVITIDSTSAPTGTPFGTWAAIVFNGAGWIRLSNVVATVS